MRPLDPEVVDAVWDQLRDLPPEPVDEHPLGCHRRRVDNRVCFRGILIRLSTGCSWEDAERLIDHAASDTTLRSRRSEWLTAGVFDQLFLNALAAYDKIIRLDLAHAAIDGSQHKAPCGGPGTGRNPTDRGKIGWKWSILCDFTGIPLGWVTEGANRQDTILLAPTLAAVPPELLARIGTLHLDRGYDNTNVRAACEQAGLTSVNIALKRQRRPGPDRPRINIPMGNRWPVERTNSWLSNYGQLRRNTDRRPEHREAQIALTIAILITAKIIDYLRDPPIR